MAEPSSLEGAGAERSLLERVLSVVTEVRAGEGITALLLTFNVFLLLTAYYVIKPVREALILVMESGAEYKSYMSGAIAIALLLAVPAYARVAKKFPRNRLVISVTLFFVSHLVLFYLAGFVPAIRANLGLLFYLWVGIFNMMVVAQFWAFANDVYTEEQGKRLFALVGLGASLGAALGTQVAEFLIEPLGLYQLLLISGGLLALCAFITQVVHVRESRAERPADSPTADAPTADEKPEEREDSDGAFSMVWRYRYLRLIALFSLVFTFVNTNGEYMLGSLFKDQANTVAEAEIGDEQAETWRAETEDSDDLIDEYLADHPELADSGPRASTEQRASLALARKKRAGQWIGIAYSKFFFWVNVLGVLIQTFLVSRLIKYLGLRVAFFILPVVAFADSLLFLVFPLLMVLRIGKTAENATDYSLNNTLRNMLWLPTTPEMKYQAKQAVDTFFVRMGDVSSAVVVFVGAGVLGLGVRAFAAVNLVLVILWLWSARAIIREQPVIRRQLGLPDDSSEAEQS